MKVDAALGQQETIQHPCFEGLALVLRGFRGLVLALPNDAFHWLLPLTCGTLSSLVFGCLRDPAESSSPANFKTPSQPFHF